MRRPAAFLSVLLLAFAIGAALPEQASAVAGYDSRYFGESAFLSLFPGQTGQFAAGFDNTGAIGWQVGTASQVNLGVCAADKVTCNVSSANSAWAQNWYSSAAYATQSTSFVGPSQTGWFVYNVRAPADAFVGTTARFNGDLVLAGTGERLHPQGYYQDATVIGSAVEPGAIDLQPSFQTARVGTYPVATATVTDTSGNPIPNLAVTFGVTSDTTANPALTMTAVTNASGAASITYTRNNPGSDTIDAYPSGVPTVRDTASIIWNLTGSAIVVTPDASATRANDASGCRTYSYTATNPSTGAALNTATLRLNFLENINRTSDQDGGATIAGDATGSPTPGVAIAETTSATGTGTFDVCGNGAVATVTPILFDNNAGGDPNLLESGDSADAGGAVTFQARALSVTLTPTDDAGRVLTDQRVYTLKVIDQFGGAYTGPVRIGTWETLDGGSATTSAALVAWIDNDSSLAAVGVQGSGAPAGATDVAESNNYLLTALNPAGMATFGLYSTASTTGQPVVWVDSNSDSAVGPAEGRALGGRTTWAASTLTSCTLTKSKPLMPVSAGSADAGLLGEGDVFVVLTFRDQSGTAVSPPSATPVTFQVTNTGGTTIAARAEGRSVDTQIPGGTSSAQATGYVIGDSDAYIVLDSASAATATVSVTATYGTTTVSCGPLSLRWIAASPEPTTGSLTGTVIDNEKGTGGSDGGGYVLQTSGGTYVITYGGGQTMIVTGSVATEAQFEAALSNGDTILWSYNGGAESHNMTVNSP